MKPRVATFYDVPQLAQTLARGRANVVLSRRHGLRLGGNVLLTLDELAPAVARWLTRASEAEALLSAHHFSALDWQSSWEDDSFPCVFLERGGLLRDEFIKVLFVNSLEPGLQFVYPYPPTERLAATLRAETDVADAAVYDPNLEAPAIIRSFPDTPLRLLSVVEQEAPDFIVQAVFNVDHDLRLLCALRERVPQARLFIGGPHLATTDHAAWLRALPVDGLIIGDGRMALLALVENLRAKQTQPVPGVIDRDSIKSGSFGNPAPATPPRAVFLDRREIVEFQSRFQSIWGLSRYDQRGAVASAGQRLLPYDVIGLNPYRVLTSQRCGKPCYWCRSPKALGPRDPTAVGEEIERHHAACDSLHFEDNEIWYAPENFKRLATELRARGLTHKPMLVKTTTDQMTPERAEFFRGLGVRIVAFGVEAFSQESLDALRKGTTVVQNQRALELTLAVGIKPGINLIWLVPGITPKQTRTLIEGVVPYLKRGAYVNLVPELELGDLRRTPALNALLATGDVRNEPRQFPGMPSPLDYFVLNLSLDMQFFKQRAMEQHTVLLAEHGERTESANLSVALWSVLFLRAMVFAFPDDAGWLAAERLRTAEQLEAVQEAVQRAEGEHCLLYAQL